MQLEFSLPQQPAGKREYFCEVCDKSMWRYPSQGGLRFCSRKHAAKGRKRRETFKVALTCEICGATFEKFPSLAHQKRCSQKCYGVTRRGERIPLAERHAAKTNYDGPVPAHCPELGQCWLWTGGRYTSGYGIFGLGARGAGTKGAHVVAWELANSQTVPNGLWVLHKCDNKLCVRPTHLFTGTPSDNEQDMIQKGRAAWQTDPTFSYQRRGDTHWMRSQPERVPRGEARSQAKLTDQGVREIRLRCAAGESKASLARTFNVSEGLIRSVVFRRCWKHVR